MKRKLIICIISFCVIAIAVSLIVFIKQSKTEEIIAFNTAKAVVQDFLKKEKGVDPFNPTGFISKTKPAKSDWTLSNTEKNDLTLSSSELNGFTIQFPSKYYTHPKSSKVITDGKNMIILSDSPANMMTFDLPAKIKNTKLNQRVQAEFNKWTNKTVLEKMTAVYNVDAHDLNNQVPFELRILNLYFLSVKAATLPLAAGTNFQLFDLPNSDVFFSGPQIFEKDFTFFLDVFPRQYPNYGLQFIFSIPKDVPSNEAKKEVYSFLNNLQINKTKKTEQKDSGNGVPPPQI